MMWGVQPWHIGNEEKLTLEQKKQLLLEKQRYLSTLFSNRANLVQCMRLVPYLLVKAEQDEQRKNEECYIWLPAEVAVMINRLLVAVCYWGKQEHITVLVDDTDHYRERSDAKHLLQVIHFFLADSRDTLEREFVESMSKMNVNDLENVSTKSHDALNDGGPKNAGEERMKGASTVLPFNLSTHGCRKQEHPVFGDVLMMQTRNRLLTLLRARPRDLRMINEFTFKPADIALLMISVSPQPASLNLDEARLENLRAKGVQRLVVVLTDLEIVRWANDRLDQFRKDVLEKLTSIGIGLSESAISFVPVSLRNGENIFVPYRDGGQSVSLLSLLNSLDVHSRSDPLSEIEKSVKPVEQVQGCKALILRSKLSNRDPNTLEVEAKVFRGAFFAHGTYFLSYAVALGGWLPVYVAEISSHFRGAKAEEAIRGDVVRLLLVLVSENDSIVPFEDLVRVNDTLQGEFLASAPLATTKDVVVRLKISCLPHHHPIYCKGYECGARIVCGTTRNEIEVTSVRLLHELDLRGTIIKKNPVFVRAGSLVVAHLHCKAAAHFERYHEDCRFGTLLLHIEGRILAFGSILALHAPFPVARKKPTAPPNESVAQKDLSEASSNVQQRGQSFTG